jgi:hypothetical protein
MTRFQVHSFPIVVVLPNRTRPRRPDFAPSSETPDVAPSSKLRKAMSGKQGGYVGQDFGELSRVAVLDRVFCSGTEFVDLGLTSLIPKGLKD